MPASDLPLLTHAARVAGRIATSFAGPSARRWDKADGAGPVTEADLAVDTYLRNTLLAARPDYGWLSEETEDDDRRLSRDTVFIVDPIDGTRSFVEGSRTWAISIAVAHRGEVTAAAIHLPLRDKLYAAGHGRGATLNDAPVRVTRTHAPPHVLAAKPNFDDGNWPGGRPASDRHYRPSLAYRLALVGQGRFEGMLTLRPSWEWDIAAGALIVTEAGGSVTDRAGAPLRFNTEGALLNGVVAAEPDLHAAMLSGLVPGVS
ncbi:3'(2'),5'-bisphosphate nucleotidase CysQ [uncultured Tateyamaria sp.]|uniref:inositol monophosphatase family protein n=1 Tax=Tateyamaria sp. 1078 TaxID=3417464 RepID=UPI00262C59FB|nr:3'(2'),5'-bisphosphate nucleotidase CysQ [uncultured Tateyamaria sp.]